MTRLADAYDALANAAATLAHELRATAPPDGPSDTEDDLPFMDTPAGRSAQGGCPLHGIPWTVREAGVSKKTGQPYKAFWTCVETNEDGSYCREKPTDSWVKAHPAR